MRAATPLDPAIGIEEALILAKELLLDKRNDDTRSPCLTLLE